MLVLRRLLIGGVVAVFGLLAASCVALPSEDTWGDVSLVGTPPQILLSFSDRMVEVNPSDGSVVQLKDADGKTRVDDQGNARVWQVMSPSGTTVHFYTRPVQTDPQTLVEVTYENKLFQIDESQARILNPDGIQLPGNSVGNPLLTDKYLYVPISNGGVIALNPKDDSQVSTFKFDTDQEKGVWTQPLLVDDTLYVSGMDHFLYALDPATGTEKWKIDLGGAVASTPVYANGALYVGSYGRSVYKITTDGKIAATFTTNDWVWGTPAVVGNDLYVGDLGGNVYALEDDGTSFKQLWTQKVATGAIRMTPLISGSTIVVGSADQNVYWLSRDTGATTFNRQMQGQVLSDILLIPQGGTVTEPTIIVSTIAKQEDLVAFTLDKGERRWAYNGS